MIKVTKKLIAGSDRVYLSETYVTNGHWAIVRTAIDPRMNSIEALQTICDRVDTMTDEKIGRSLKLAIDASRKWTITGWLHELSSRETARVAIAEDGSRMFLGEEYCKAFGLTAGSMIYATDENSPARLSGDDLIVIMPRRSGIAELPAAPAKKTDAA